MKYLFSLVTFGAFLLVGCANLETVAYKTIGTTAVTVDGAMKGWGDWVRAGKATPRDEVVVKSAYSKYQASISTLKQAVIAAKSAPEGQASLETALQATEAAAGELVLLISTFTRGP